MTTKPLVHDLESSKPTLEPCKVFATGEVPTGDDSVPTSTRGAISLPPLLNRFASEAAELWASRVRSRTLEENRRASGGWPGTLTEARCVVSDHLLPSLGLESLRELVRIDREQVARFVYRSARTWWNQRQQRDVEEVG